MRVYLLALLVLACGKTVQRPRLVPAGEDGGQPSEPVMPDPRQAFAFGVASPPVGGGAVAAYACTTEGALALGLSEEQTGRLSPDGKHWAVARRDGVDVIEAPSLSTQRLAGRDVALGSLRWSEDGERLGYFAGGFPMLAAGDGSHGTPLDVTLPDPDEHPQLPLVDWSGSGEWVAFLSRGVVVVAQRDGSAPRTLTRRAARLTVARGLALSRDGRTAAVVLDSSRALALIDAKSAAVTETDLVAVTTLHAWSADGEWLLASTPGGAALVSRAGEVRTLRGHATISPTAPVVALSDRGIVLASLDGSEQRRLSESPLESGPLFFRPDGRALQHLDVSEVRVLDSETGESLLGAPSWGLFGPDEWFAMPGPEEVRLTRLDDATSGTRLQSSLPLALAQGAGAWLADGRFALADDRGVRLISLDGESVEVCPDMRRVDGLQAPLGF